MIDLLGQQAGLFSACWLFLWSHFLSCNRALAGLDPPLKVFEENDLGFLFIDLDRGGERVYTPRMRAQHILESLRLQKSWPTPLSVRNWLAHTEPTDPLMGILAGDDDPALRMIVLDAIQTHPTASNRAILQRLLKDEDQEVREAALAVESELEALARMSLFLILANSTLGAYSGGGGTAEDPYRIATAEDLIALGNDPCNYNKHFALTADIDLSSYSFDRAVIAPDTGDYNSSYSGIGFSGSFDGQGHRISSLQINGNHYLGLFGLLETGALITNLSLQT